MGHRDQLRNRTFIVRPRAGQGKGNERTKEEDKREGPVLLLWRSEAKRVGLGSASRVRHDKMRAVFDNEIWGGGQVKTRSS